MANKLLTITQVAELMQVTKKKVYQIVDAGLMETINTSKERGTRIPEFEYERFLRDALGQDIEDMIAEKLESE